MAQSKNEEKPRFWYGLHSEHEKTHKLKFFPVYLETWVLRWVGWGKTDVLLSFAGVPRETGFGTMSKMLFLGHVASSARTPALRSCHSAGRQESPEWGDPSPPVYRKGVAHKVYLSSDMPAIILGVKTAICAQVSHKNIMRIRFFFWISSPFVKFGQHKSSKKPYASVCRWMAIPRPFAEAFRIRHPRPSGTAVKPRMRLLPPS